MALPVVNQPVHEVPPAIFLWQPQEDLDFLAAGGGDWDAFIQNRRAEEGKGYIGIPLNYAVQ